MKTSNDIDKIAPALMQLQAEMGNIAKSKKGYGYKYADLPAVFDELRPLLHKHSLFVMQPISSNDSKLSISTYIYHASGQYFGETFDVSVDNSNKKMNDAQAIGSTITYMRRYGLASMLSIVTEDDDGRASHAKIPEPVAQKFPNTDVYTKLHDLIIDLKVPTEEVNKLLARAGADKISDFSSEQAMSAIDYFRKRFGL